MAATEKKSNNAGLVLATAIKNLGAEFGWTNERLASILCVHRNQLKKLYTHGIDPESVQGQISILLVRIFRGIVALIGNDNENIRHWLATKNYALNDSSPQEMLSSLEGTVNVVQYLDAMRGKN